MDQKDKTWALVLVAVIILLIGLLAYRLGLAQNILPTETPIPTPTPIGNIIPAPNTF